jgi:GNAT superfamily N-acetyltransferase
MRSEPLNISVATIADAAEISTLRDRTADHLTLRHGRGHWDRRTSEASVLRDIKTSTVLVARDEGRIAGTLRLATKKPWAIDRSYFVPCNRPLYLLDMAVDPGGQGKGIGRQLVEAAKGVARAFPADAIWLDAYDAEAGAGGFYERCGFVEVGRAAYRGVPLIYYDWRP